MAFFQEPPRLTNTFAGDRVLRSFLQRWMPEGIRKEVEPTLSLMGELSATEHAEICRAHRLDEPRHVPFDAWGRRVDVIEVNDAWKLLAKAAATHGLVGTAYERRHGNLSRAHQMALVYLFAPSSQTYSCPLAMTDGCARTLEVLGSKVLKETVLPRLTSRDPELSWTSGQWMTERTGGSDVGLSETVARAGNDGTFRLHGTKWFTSAVTSEVALTLARPEGNGPGGKGLALFFLRVRDADGHLNHITVHRLKDKLGTRHLPTAELTLDGTIAEPVAGLRDGIRNMASMLNITRTWNAVSAVAGMQRGLALSRDYAKRRVAFGAPLSEKALHLDTLADLAADHEAAFLLTFHEVLLLGKQETGEATANETALLRVLQPLTKLLTGKLAVSSASEVLECFGGAGYVEDTGLPALLRDAQVLSIWEGTTNVLSLETIRALSVEDAWDPVLEAVSARAQSAIGEDAKRLAEVSIDAAKRAIAWARRAAGENRPALEAGARRFAMTLGRAVALALTLEHAAWASQNLGDRRTLESARRFARRGVDLLHADDDSDMTRSLALGE